MVSEKKRKAGSSEIKTLDKSSRSTRRMKNCMDTCILPIDVIFNIFLLLPADVVYYIMRRVCRSWYNLIHSPSFISAHLERSRIGLLLSEKQLMGRSVLKLTSDHGLGGVQVKDLNHIKCTNGIRATCNGLVFVLGPEYSNYNCACYIANLITKQQLPLPKIPHFTVFSQYCLAYAASSGVYKVCCKLGLYFNILTIGVDKAWRNLDVSALTSYAQALIRCDSAISLKGNLYWVHRDYTEAQYILCFDIETESFKRIPLPCECEIPGLRNRLLAMDTSLSLCRKLNNYSFKFWLLKDEQWVEMRYIKLTDQIRVIKRVLRCIFVNELYPCGWLRSGELLVFRADQGMFIYNVNTLEIHQPDELKDKPSLLNDDVYSDIYSYAHVDSLIPINNLSLALENPPKMFRSSAKEYSKENMRAEFDEPLP